MGFVFFVKQKTSFEMRISDWSSDVCSSDLVKPAKRGHGRVAAAGAETLCGAGIDQAVPTGLIADAEPGRERRFLRRTRRAARPEVRRSVLKIVEAEFGAGHAAAKRQGQPVRGLPVDLPESGQLCILGAVVAGVKYAVGQHASGCEEQVDWHSEPEHKIGENRKSTRL